MANPKNLTCTFFHFCVYKTEAFKSIHTKYQIWWHSRLAFSCHSPNRYKISKWHRTNTTSTSMWGLQGQKHLYLCWLWQTWPFTAKSTQNFTPTDLIHKIPVNSFPGISPVPSCQASVSVHSLHNLGMGELRESICEDSDKDRGMVKPDLALEASYSWCNSFTQ